MQETLVRSLSQEDSLKKEMATHSSILAWKIPWTEEHGGYSNGISKNRTRLSHTHTQPEDPLGLNEGEKVTGPRLALHLGQGCWGFQFFCASGLLGFGQNDNGQVPSTERKESPARSPGGWRPLLTEVWGIVVCMARLPGVASQLQSDS